MDKPILYVDLDGVCANFDKMMAKLLPNVDMGDGEDYEARSLLVNKAIAEYPRVFEDLELIDGAWASLLKLRDKYEIYFLSTPVHKVPESYMGKRIWVEKNFGEWAAKRLILTHRKDLCIGDILIDDRLKNGVDKFKGRHIHFGSKEYPDWTSVFIELNK